MLLHGRKARRLRRRSLVLRFALVSGILTGIFGAVLTFWLASFIQQNHLSQARDNATYSLSLALNTAYKSGQSPSSSFTAAQYVATTDFLRAAVATGKYVGATAWTAPDKIVYASQANRRGTTEKARAELATAFAGALTSVVVREPLPAVPDITERKALQQVGPVVEIFVPVRVEGTIIAVVELYEPWNPVEKQINDETTAMLLIVSGGLILLWLGLLGFVISAARQLRLRDEANWHLASHDVLTGLPNRKLISERVESALGSTSRGSAQVGVLLIDLDGFKEVNDSLGHHVGDALLAQIGPRLVRALRTTDSVARLGGDEFVVLLPDLADAAEALATAQRISAEFSEPFALDGLELDVSVSIGIAISPAHGNDFAALLQRADVGMYAAKHAGSGVATYSPGAERDLATTRHAQQALARRIRPRTGGVEATLP